MSPEIRRAALVSTSRGCGFAVLAIVTGMIGFASEPALALKIGGVSFLLAAAILILKAWRAPRMPFRSTEVWLLLDDADRPSPGFAQTAISGARVEAFYRFAHMAATIAAVLLTGALLAGLIVSG
jgi:hypothetical protein